MLAGKKNMTVQPKAGLLRKVGTENRNMKSKTGNRKPKTEEGK